MATSSVAMPATPGDDEAGLTAPAMLDRARGLAAAGIAAGAAAAAAAATVASSTTPKSTSKSRAVRKDGAAETPATMGGGGAGAAAAAAALLDAMMMTPSMSASSSSSSTSSMSSTSNSRLGAAPTATTAGIPAPMSPTRPGTRPSHRVTQGGRVSKISRPGSTGTAGHGHGSGPGHRPQRPSSSSISSSSVAASAAAALAAAAATLSSVSSTSASPTAGTTTPATTATATTTTTTAATTAPNSTTTTPAAAPNSTTTFIDDSSAASSRHNSRRRGGSSSNGANSRTSSSSSLSSSSMLAASTPASSISSSSSAHAAVNPMTAGDLSSASNMAIDSDAFVLSFWGPDPVPLPSRFSRIKRNLIRGHEAELEACWARLTTALRAEVEHIEGLGAHLIPSIEFADVDDPAQNARFGRDLRRYGVGVIRKVVPKPDADTMVRQTVDYLDDAVARSNNSKTPQPLPQDPTCYDFFYTPAQVRARAHPSVLRAQRFMMGMWETTPDDRLATRFPITYVDRIRIHNNSPSAFGTTPASRAEPEQGARPLGLQPPPPVHTGDNPQSADDWITALQSSAGIIAQVDNGSLERWEPDGYQRAGTYNNVFHGRFEDYDPWESASRTSATMDLYNGYGACTIYRMFQGVLALSTIEPGMIRLLPSPKLATAYYLLRPFFSPRTPAPPGVRSGPEWDAYLHHSNWKLERNPDTIIHGAVPGHAQRITEHWHPHLHLRSSMITLPTLQPGDYILWHPDLPYHISSNNPGLKTPTPGAGPRDDVSMLVYIPAAPLTQTNALYLARQRKAFQRGHPGPDFDSSGRTVLVEDSELRPGEKEIANVGGPAALQAMGFAPWEAAATRAGTPPPLASKYGAKDEDTEMTEAYEETKSLGSSASGSHAEAEVIRLSNIILFPDRSMLGYSV